MSFYMIAYDILNSILFEVSHEWPNSLQENVKCRPQIIFLGLKKK